MNQAHESQKGKIREKWFGGHKRVSSRSSQQRHQWLTLGLECQPTLLSSDPNGSKQDI